MTAITYLREDVRIVRKPKESSHTPNVFVEYRQGEEWTNYAIFDTDDNSVGVPDAMERARVCAQMLCKKLYKQGKV
jgi:hypothetical protein